GDKVREANEWAERYHELEKQLSLNGDESRLSQEAEDYLHQGELEKAGAVLDQILEKEEKKVDRVAANHYNRGLVFVLQFRYPEAIPHLKQAYEYRPDDLNYANALALVLMFEREFRDAEPVLLHALNRARQLSPNGLSGDRSGLARTLSAVG